MLYKLNLEHILFLDIETVPQKPSFSDLDENSQILWEQKSQYQRKDEISAEDFYERAGIWAEFGKVVCISVGYFVLKGERDSIGIILCFWIGEGGISVKVWVVLVSLLS